MGGGRHIIKPMTDWYEIIAWGDSCKPVVVHVIMRNENVIISKNADCIIHSNAVAKIHYY